MCTAWNTHNSNYDKKVYDAWWGYEERLLLQMFVWLKCIRRTNRLMSYLPLVMYTTTSIMMPTLLNINAVNWRQWSLARSANGGLGKLCRLRNDLNDLCRSIVRVFHSFSLEFDDHKQIMLYSVLQCVNTTKKTRTVVCRSDFLSRVSIKYGEIIQIGQ